MREAIGNSYILNFIITFIIIFILIFVGTLTYTKAFKVKNKIIDTIEYNNGELTNGNVLKSDVETTIREKLRLIGYRIDNSNTECSTAGRFANSTLISRGNDGYRYCIYTNSTSKGNYYSVVAYAY